MPNLTPGEGTELSDMIEKKIIQDLLIELTSNLKNGKEPAYFSENKKAEELFKKLKSTDNLIKRLKTLKNGVLKKEILFRLSRYAETSSELYKFIIETEPEMFTIFNTADDFKKYLIDTIESQELFESIENPLANRGKKLSTKNLGFIDL